MKKALIITGIVIAVLAVLAFVFRDTLQFAMMRMMLKPSEAFADTVAPDPPDYTNLAHWAALPEREDNADVTPAGITDNQAFAAADVFFIHPTTYYSNEGWNQPLGNATANGITDNAVMRGQASVFNGCCRIYAPRYRQATLFAFFDLQGEGQPAIDLAYTDVERAFDYYLDHFNDGRPFILAGHSQGGLHLDTLLDRRIHATPLAARVIAAYPVGYYLDDSNGIPVCTSPSQTGCQVTWNSLAPEAQAFSQSANDICVNPLNWRTDGSHADFAENLGAVAWGGFSDDVPTRPGEPIPGVADARCDGSRLIVTEIRSPDFPSMFGEGNYHIYDYSLFYMNIRENAELRTRSYFAGQLAGKSARHDGGEPGGQ